MEACHPFRGADVCSFLALARSQGWVSGEWELEFLLRAFPEGALVWRDEGRVSGYVTSLKHGKSGWIGNLLVLPEARRRGIGRSLMECAVAALLKSGVETIWLTASEDGAGLYLKLGFVPIDHIKRWSGKGSVTPKRPSRDEELVGAVDRAGWGDNRDALLQVTRSRGEMVTSSGGFICSQQWSHGTQIGPWGCLIGSQASGLWDQMVTGAQGDVFLDVPAGNYAAVELLSRRGFSVQGSNVLMYFGERPRYRPDHIYALASMGSMG